MAHTPDYAALTQALTDAQRILLTTHEHPDGDALGSVCMMYDALVSVGKEVTIYCHDAPQESFSFLPHVTKVTTTPEHITWATFDVVVVVDCASLQRTGIARQIAALRCPIINIDHHLSNDHFGDINVVDPEAVATTAILYTYYRAVAHEITPAMATCILTGILTDSGNFSYAATNAYTFDMASDMLRRGANVRDIIAATTKNKRLPMLKIWGLALSRLQHNKTYDIAYTVLTQADLVAYGVDTDDLEGLSNFLNTLKDATIVMVLYELADGRVKGSFRTTREGVDVSLLAQYVGGGGHAKAAGFEVVGRLEEVSGSWRVV